MSELTIRRTSFGATCPGCGASGDGCDVLLWSTGGGVETHNVKNPVTAPAMHSWRNDMRSQNSSAETSDSSPRGRVSFSLSSSSRSSFSRGAFSPRGPDEVGARGRLRWGERTPLSVVSMYAISSMNRDFGSSSNHGMNIPRLCGASGSALFGHGSGTSVWEYGCPYTHCTLASAPLAGPGRERARLIVCAASSSEYPGRI